MDRPRDVLVGYLRHAFPRFYLSGNTSFNPSVSSFCKNAFFEPACSSRLSRATEDHRIRFLFVCQEELQVKDEAQALLDLLQQLAANPAD